MFHYLDSEQQHKALLWLLGLCILIGYGIWSCRKRWIVASTVGIFILIWGWIAIIEAFVPHDHIFRAICINNLRAIDDAKTRWAAEHHKEKIDVPTDADLFGDGLDIKSKPVCPYGGKYILGRVNENPKCSLGESKGHKLGETN